MGFATAALLLSQGAKVSIADVSEKALAEAATRLDEIKNCTTDSSGDFMTTQVDVRKVDQVDEWIKRTVERFGKLDGGVNLAGVIPKGINVDRLEEMPDEDWQFVMDVNLSGGMNHATSDFMIEMC
jgi:NAD(P)-dependent dehydrogenase (short-subunit alcohol dehydrogenase family)